MLRFHIQNQTMACTYKYKGETYDKAAMLSKIIKDNIYVEGDKLAAQKWIEEKLGNQHVEFVAGLIEGDAFGQFTSDGTILLSENFEKGTEYHEAFHRVWQTMLTPQERSVIESEISEESLTEVAKLYPNLSQSKLKEEYLAESFRDFVLNDGGIKFANNTKNFFDRLLDLIKKLFGKNKLTMTELFEAVNRGEYRNKKISYPVVITPMKSVTGFDVEESSELVRSMAQRMLSALFATPDRFQQFVKNQMPYSDILKLRDWAFMEVMGDVRDNFDLDKAYAYSLKESEFYVELNKYLSQFNIEVDVDTEKFEQDSQEKDYANYKEAFKFDDKTRFSALVKLLLASVPSSTKSNKLGLQINADWASLSSQLASKLSDTSISTDALFRELKEVNTPETDRVLEILGGTNEEFLEKSKSNPKHYLDQFYLRQEFHNAFTKHWYKFQTTAINNGKFYSFNSNLEAGDKRILNEYKNKIESDVQRIELYMKQKPGEITNVVEAYVNWRDTGKRIWDNENHLVNFEVTRLDGKDINGNTARHYLEGLSGYFENVAKNSKSTWKESFAKKFEGVEVGAEEIFDSIGGYLRQLSFIENEYRSETELSIFNVAGNKVFPVNLHTFQTTVLASLKYYTNMSEESGMEELFDLEAEGKITASEIDAILEEQEKWEDWFSRISPINEAVLRAREPYLFNSYTENSIWLKNILEQRSVPELIIYDGVSPISNDIDGKELADLDPTDLFVAFMGGLYNQGGSTGEESGNRSSRSIVYPAFKHSDRSVMYGYMFENLAPFDKVDKAEVEKEFAKNYTGYLKDQENFKKAYNNNLDLYKEVAHVNPNDKPLLTERDPSVVLKAETEKLHRALEYNGLLKLIDDKPVGISSELWEASGNNLNTALTYLTSESFVGFMEQTKLFTGNPAFYSSASNLFKRLNAQSSTGSPGTVDKVTNFYMEWLNAETASKYGVTYPKKTDGRITEIISKEVDKYVSEHAENIYKVYYDHAIENGIANPEAYANRFKRAYSKVNENDGQSWINIFAWREFYVRTEGWNKSLQRTFDIEMAILTGKENNIIQEILDRFIPIYVEEYNPDKTVEYYRENPDEAFTIYFKQFMEPMRVIKGQYAGPVKVSNGERDSYDIPTADKIFIPGVRKTSYMPLVPSMIKGTNLEKLNSLMLEEGLDILHMESGAKVGAHKRLNMYDEGGNFILDSMYREARQMGDFSYDSELDFRFMKNQVKISGKEKSKIIAATQARKNMLQNFKGPDGTWTDEALGKEYIDLHRQIVKLALDEIDELVNSDVKTFVEKIRNSLEAQNEPENVFNALALLEDEGFLEMLPNRNIVENIIFSAIGKKGIRIKQTGNAYVQVAPSMFETGIRKTDGKNLYASNELKFYLDSNGNIQEAEVMVPLPQSWIPKVFNYYKSTGEVTDGNLIKVIELLNRDMANGKFQNNVTFKGLRIPNQQVSSNDIFKVKKFFLPTVSNFVVVPAELVVKTGSDFDVDKLQLYMPNLGKNFEYISFQDSVEQDYIDFINGNSENNREIYQSVKAQLKLTQSRSWGGFKANINRVKKEAKDVKKALIDEFWKDLGAEGMPQVVKDTVKSAMSMLDEDVTFLQKLGTAWAVVGQEIESMEEIKSYGDYPELSILLVEYKFMRASIKDYVEELLALEESTKDSLDILYDKTKKRSSEIFSRLGFMAAQEKAKLYGLPTFEEFSNRSELDRKSLKKIENRLIQVDREILLHPKNFPQTLAVIDDDMLKKDVFTDLVAAMKESSYKGFAPVIKNMTEFTDKGAMKFFDILNIPQQVQQKINAVDSKFGVGIVATEVTGHTVFQLHGVEVSETMVVETTDKEGNVVEDTIETRVFSKGEDLYALNSVYDSEGNLITEVLSVVLTSQVDAGKNPYATLLNINKNTLSVLTYMIRRGESVKNAIYLLNQPIVSEYLRQLNINNSLLYRSEHQNPVGRTPGNNLRKGADKIQEEVKAQFPNVVKEGQGYRENLVEQTNQHEMLKRFMNIEAQTKVMLKYKQGASPDTTIPKNMMEYEKTKLAKAESDKSGLLINAEGISSDGLLSPFFEVYGKFEELKKFYYMFSIDNYAERLKEVTDHIFKPDEKQKVLDKINAEFPLYLIQNLNSVEGYDMKGVFNRLFKSSESQNIAARVIEAAKKFDNPFLDALASKVKMSEQKDGYWKGVPSIKFFSPKDPFALNNFIEHFQAVKSLDETLYKDLVMASLLQAAINPSVFSWLNVFSNNDFDAKLFKAAFQMDPNQINFDTFLMNFFSNNVKFLPDTYQIENRLKNSWFGKVGMSKEYNRTTRSYMVVLKGKKANPRGTYHVKNYESNTFENVVELEPIIPTSSGISEEIIKYVNSRIPNYFNKPSKIIEFVATAKSLQLLSMGSTKEDLLWAGEIGEKSFKEWKAGDNYYTPHLDNILINIIMGKLAKDGLSESDIWENLFRTASNKLQIFTPSKVVDSIYDPSLPKVNIYAGTGENAALSNFAQRPFKFGDILYPTVEHAFQLKKLRYASGYSDNEISELISKVNKGSAAQAKAFGKTVKNLNIEKWNEDAYFIIKDLIRHSFWQNPKAKELLLNTGEAELTHTQDKSRWGKDFPLALMKVRQEFQNEDKNCILF